MEQAAKTAQEARKELVGACTPGARPRPPRPPRRRARAAQAWARMEEREGALQRADELRNFRMQARGIFGIMSNVGISPYTLP
jgi:hypothetical protein